MGMVFKPERLVQMSARLSRRDAGTQLWLIEAAAQRNDTGETLEHYDIALRTKADTRDILFPRLLNAIDDAEIRQALKPYVHGKNRWIAEFISYANANSKNRKAIVDLIVETGRLGRCESGANPIA